MRKEQRDEINGSSEINKLDVNIKDILKEVLEDQREKKF